MKTAFLLSLILLRLLKNIVVAMVAHIFVE